MGLTGSHVRHRTLGGGQSEEEKNAQETDRNLEIIQELLKRRRADVAKITFLKRASDARANVLRHYIRQEFDSVPGASSLHGPLGREIDSTMDRLGIRYMNDTELMAELNAIAASVRKIDLGRDAPDWLARVVRLEGGRALTGGKIAIKMMNSPDADTHRVRTAVQAIAEQSAEVERIRAELKSVKEQLANAQRLATGGDQALRARIGEIEVELRQARAEASAAITKLQGEHADQIEAVRREHRNEILQKNAELTRSKVELKRVQDATAGQDSSQVEELRRRVAEKEGELATAQRQAADDLAKFRAEHAAALDAVRDEHTRVLEQQTAIAEAAGQRLIELQNAIPADAAGSGEQIRKLQEEKQALETQLRTLTESNAALQQQASEAASRLVAQEDAQLLDMRRSAIAALMSDLRVIVYVSRGRADLADDKYPSEFAETHHAIMSLAYGQSPKLDLNVMIGTGNLFDVDVVYNNDRYAALWRSIQSISEQVENSLNAAIHNIFSVQPYVDQAAVAEYRRDPSYQTVARTISSPRAAGDSIPCLQAYAELLKSISDSVKIPDEIKVRLMNAALESLRDGQLCSNPTIWSTSKDIIVQMLSWDDDSRSAIRRDAVLGRADVGKTQAQRLAEEQRQRQEAALLATKQANYRELMASDVIAKFTDIKEKVKRASEARPDLYQQIIRGALYGSVPTYLDDQYLTRNTPADAAQLTNLRQYTEAVDKLLALKNAIEPLELILQDLIGSMRVLVRMKKLLPPKTSVIQNVTDTSLEIDGATYTANRVLGENATQEDVFENVENFIKKALHGGEVFLVAYGQTGSGKTHTMMGKRDASNNIVSGQEGVIPRSFETLQNYLNGWSPDSSRGIRFSMSAVEYYREAGASDAVNDLLLKHNQDVAQALDLHKSMTKDETKLSPRTVHCRQISGQTRFANQNVIGLAEYIANRPERQEVYTGFEDQSTCVYGNVTRVAVDIGNNDLMMTLIDAVQSRRRTSGTAANRESSRSHMVVTLFVERDDETIGYLHLADLAGSETALRSFGNYHILETKQQLHTRPEALRVANEIVGIRNTRNASMGRNVREISLFNDESTDQRIFKFLLDYKREQEEGAEINESLTLLTNIIRGWAKQEPYTGASYGFGIIDLLKRAQLGAVQGQALTRGRVMFIVTVAPDQKEESKRALEVAQAAQVSQGARVARTPLGAALLPGASTAAGIAAAAAAATTTLRRAPTRTPAPPQGNQPPQVSRPKGRRGGNS